MGKAILEVVIDEWEKYPLSTMLFVPDGLEVTPRMEVFLVPFVNRLSRGPAGTRYYLGIEQIRDVVDALKQEGLEPTAEQKFLAVKHYAENDAFIDPTELCGPM
ncbi:MAG: hypothetical protein ABI134_01800 [Byssovorax sp.]